MLYIYRVRASEGASLLAEDILLKGVRARRTQGEALRNNVQAGDQVVCWGDPLPRLRVAADQLKVLNNKPHMSKFSEAETLKAAGVPTVEVSRTKPQARARGPFVENVGPRIERGNIQQAERGIELLQSFIREERQRRQEWERLPAVVEEWLPRRNDHVGGSDLLRTPAVTDYYSKKETIVEEYRLHMFNGKSIRAGVKRARDQRPDGGPAHPWIRSFNAGWIIAYTGFQSTKEMRDLAARAVKALGLDFGAVDLAKRADGSLIVLEVNRAPGVEGGTSEAYADKIIAWSRGE
jgi:hypothetical protein